MATPRVVVIGGGFGGLATVQALRRAPVHLTLVDKRNHHLFQPLLYQVATAALAPSDIAEPLRGILGGQANADVMLAEVTGIDVDRRVVHTEEGELPYDHLVVAAGATHAYFGHDDWAEHAPGLKTIGDALRIRHRILSAFEEAEWTDDPQARKRLCTFVVVGAGPTGVELAGALREIACQTLTEDFHHVTVDAVRVVLVEAAPAVLGPFPKPLQEAARAQLEQLGVEVRTATPVKGMGPGRVEVEGEVIEASTILWAAGVQASPLGAMLGVDLDRAGRVHVAPDLSLPGHPEVRVIGDMAHVEQDGHPVPGVAPAAIQMGHHVAASIRGDLVGHDRVPFRYHHKGSLATVGRRLAVADLGRWQGAGFVAWLIWVFVHLMTLVGHRNRVVVFVKWAWSWATFDRSSRLLWLDEDRRDVHYEGKVEPEPLVDAMDPEAPALSPPAS
ncbi:MAG: NAD(P)/FAD-dependent oxidoreductase [Alphaproteobacteria bacterium]|nr:NAD(P)/FAD-dependent oxidoreductase [Alphaproteobacteria bacterium]